jgi:hypothetical protein
VNSTVSLTKGHLAGLMLLARNVKIGFSSVGDVIIFEEASRKLKCVKADAMRRDMWLDWFVAAFDLYQPTMLRT